MNWFEWQKHKEERIKELIHEMKSSETEDKLIGELADLQKSISRADSMSRPYSNTEYVEFNITQYGHDRPYKTNLYLDFKEAQRVYDLLNTISKERREKLFEEVKEKKEQLTQLLCGK